jgi:hypothetical protein
MVRDIAIVTPVLDDWRPFLRIAQEIVPLHNRWEAGSSNCFCTILSVFLPPFATSW